MTAYRVERSLTSGVEISAVRVHYPSSGVQSIDLSFDHHAAREAAPMKARVSCRDGLRWMASPAFSVPTLQDVDVALFLTDTAAVLPWSPPRLMDGITQRNQQLTPPPECGDVSNLIMLDGQHVAEHDWTEDLPKTDHVRFFREIDWSKSSLGPLNTWSPTLRLFTGFVLADSRAACLWWYVTE